MTTKASNRAITRYFTFKTGGIAIRAQQFSLFILAVTLGVPVSVALAQDDIADVPAQDLRAGGDAMKRYFLVGTPAAAEAAGAGQGLLIILPGGDGSADFQPFIRRVYKHALKPGWLVAQPVAPKWDAQQFDTLVWPTAKLQYPAAKFTTEEFVAAVIADVDKKAKIDPARVFILGWSSGGPPSYAAALAQNSKITGTFVAMSVFKPDQLPPLPPARGKPFYVLQSPDDKVTPVRFAEAAQRDLTGAGAVVKFDKYPGGHGWQGNPFQMISTGVQWLEQQAPARK